MSKLKLSIHKLEKAVVVQLLEMDAKLFDGIHNVFTASNSFQITLESFDLSIYRLDIHSLDINAHEDLKFETNQERDEWISRCTQALNEFKNKVIGTSEKKDESPVITFEF